MKEEKIKVEESNWMLNDMLAKQNAQVLDLINLKEEKIKVEESNWILNDILTKQNAQVLDLIIENEKLRGERLELENKIRDMQKKSR